MLLLISLLKLTLESELGVLIYMLKMYISEFSRCRISRLIHVKCFVIYLMYTDIYKNLHLYVSNICHLSLTK